MESVVCARQRETRGRRLTPRQRCPDERSKAYLHGATLSGQAPRRPADWLPLTRRQSQLVADSPSGRPLPVDLRRSVQTVEFKVDGPRADSGPGSKGRNRPISGPAPGSGEFSLAARSAPAWPQDERRLDHRRFGFSTPRPGADRRCLSRWRRDAHESGHGEENDRQALIDNDVAKQIPRGFPWPDRE